jgi:hypothetical protein
MDSTERQELLTLLRQKAATLAQERQDCLDSIKKIEQRQAVLAQEQEEINIRIRDLTLHRD